MALFSDNAGVALGTSVFLLALALGLPDLTLGIFGFDFSNFNSGVVTIMRVGLIIIAISIGLKPLENDNKFGL